MRPLELRRKTYTRPSSIGTVFDTLSVMQTRNTKNFNVHLYTQKLLFVTTYLHTIGSDFLVRILSKKTLNYIEGCFSVHDLSEMSCSVTFQTRIVCKRQIGWFWVEGRKLDVFSLPLKHLFTASDKKKKRKREMSLKRQKQRKCQIGFLKWTLLPSPLFPVNKCSKTFRIVWKLL